MSQVKNDEIRQHVRNRYKQIVVGSSTDLNCCSPTSSANSCCGTLNEVSLNEVSKPGDLSVSSRFPGFSKVDGIKW